MKQISGRDKPTQITTESKPRLKDLSRWRNSTYSQKTLKFQKLDRAKSAQSEANAKTSFTINLMEIPSTSTIFLSISSTETVMEMKK